MNNLFLKMIFYVIALTVIGSTIGCGLLLFATGYMYYRVFLNPR